MYFFNIFNCVNAKQLKQYGFPEKWRKIESRCFHILLCNIQFSDEISFTDLLPRANVYFRESVAGLNEYCRIKLNVYCMIKLNEYCRIKLNEYCMIKLNEYCRIKLNVYCRIKLNEYCRIKLNVYLHD